MSPDMESQPIDEKVVSPSSASDTGDESGNGTDTNEFPVKDESYFDSWRGWIVVIAASCSLFMYMGVIYSWGILQAKMADSKGYSLTTLTFVGSLATSFMVSLCIGVGKLVRKFGYRKTALAGGVLLGLGEFLSSWVVGHLWALFITHGILFGVGGGLTILVCQALCRPIIYLLFVPLLTTVSTALLHCPVAVVPEVSRPRDRHRLRRWQSRSGRHGRRSESTC